MMKTIQNYIKCENLEYLNMILLQLCYAVIKVCLIIVIIYSLYCIFKSGIIPDMLQFDSSKHVHNLVKPLYITT
jgi:hypothetical protein